MDYKALKDTKLKVDKYLTAISQHGPEYEFMFFIGPQFSHISTCVGEVASIANFQFSNSNLVCGFVLLSYSDHFEKNINSCIVYWAYSHIECQFFHNKVFRKNSISIMAEGSLKWIMVHILLSELQSTSWTHIRDGQYDSYCMQYIKFTFCFSGIFSSPSYIHTYGLK